MKINKKIPYSKAILVVGTVMMTESCAHMDYATDYNIPETGNNLSETETLLTKNFLPKRIMGEKKQNNPVVVSHSITAPGVIPPYHMARFLLSRNTGFNPSTAMEIATIYWEEGKKEGINSDLAFAQMCLETNYLKFTGTVKPEQNNMCGLGVVSDKVQGHYFPSIRVGIRAHIQHLKAYGSDQPLNGDLVDPRFNLVKRNSAPDLTGLTGLWALDNQYDKKIASLMESMRITSLESEDNDKIVRFPEVFEPVL